jgi:GT2 family glycosyltransferase
MKTLIAVPCMDTIESDFVNCLLQLKPVGDVEIRLLKGSLVYDARNQITKYALGEDFDFVLWLDSDMTFDADLMEKLMADIEGAEDGVKKDAVTGLCFGRRPPFKPCIYSRLEVDQDGNMVRPIAENWYDYPRDQVFEVEACGFACVLMRIGMLQAMGIYGVPFYPVGGMGEDLTFCWRARKLNLKFHCDSRLKIGHIMRLSVDEAFRDTVMEKAGQP